MEERGQTWEVLACVCLESVKPVQTETQMTRM